MRYRYHHWVRDEPERIRMIKIVTALAKRTDLRFMRTLALS